MGTSTSKQKTRRSQKQQSYFAEKPSSPSKPTLKFDSENPDPNIVTIRWDAPLFDGGSKITGYLVEHRRTGSPHWLKSSPTKVQQNQLTVSGLEPGWRFQFRVSAENAIGLSEPSPISEPLSIFVHRSAAIAPYFIVELCDVIAIENEKVEFSVSFEGIPFPKISWYKDGLEVYSNRLQKVNTDGCVSTFVIHEVSISDESEIKCSATNRVGYAVTKAFLTVQAPPTIRLPRQYDEGLLYEEGETIRLKVSVAGQPQSTIEWFHDNELLCTDDRHEISYSDKTAMLKIKNALRCDRGEYQIKASNELGEDSSTILVTIANKPQPPQDVLVEKCVGRSIVLSWKKPDDDGGCKIGSYIVEYYKDGWNVWLKAITCRKLSATLDDLIEGSQYKFRVKAENPYGVSEASPETNPVFIPDPKRGLFEPQTHLENNKTSSNVEHESFEQICPSVTVSDVEQFTEYGLNKLQNHDQQNEQTLCPSITISDVEQSVQYSLNKMQNHDRQNNCGISEKQKAPVKPLRKNKFSKNEIENESILNVTTDCNDNLNCDRFSPSPTSSSSNMENTSQASSELLLVLVPNTKDTEHKKDMKLTFTEPAIPPPMSLSAPELGSSTSLFPPLRRNCVSSTELLHETAVARVYRDMLKEDTARIRRHDSFNRLKMDSPVRNERNNVVIGQQSDCNNTVDGRYSRKGTFHYSDIFVENLARLAKYELTGDSLLGAGGGLIAKRPISVPLAEDDESESSSESDSTDYDESDTYHMDNNTPLSFERALEISNPRRYVNDYAAQLKSVVRLDSEEKLLKSILKNTPDRCLPDVGMSKKQVRIEEPARPTCNEYESKVVVNHYSDIVKQYGGVSKATNRIYLTYDELKAAAQLSESNDRELENHTMNAESIFEMEPAVVSQIGVTHEEDTASKINTKVRFYFDFTLDLIMFVSACWLYCFKDERLAIPIILLMVYRQAYDKIKNASSSFKFWK